MSRKAFHNLLERYLKGKCTQEEQETVRRWYDLLDSDADLNLSEVEFGELEDRLWEKINRETQPNEGKKKDRPTSIRLFKKSYVAACAAIALLIVSSVWIYIRLKCNPVEPDFVNRKESLITKVINPYDESLEVVLPDSSRVKLFSGAELSYATQFDKREVSLTGDALFDVKGNPSNPFIVFHDEMITRVLGTRFKIQSGGASGREEVIVYTGKVQVIRSAKNNLVKRVIETPKALNLTMNQRAILDQQRDSFSETLVERPIPIETKRTLLNDGTFSEVTLNELAGKLSEAYNVAIKVNPTIRKVTFTGDLSNMELFNQLDVVCNVTETSYRIVNTTIEIR
ncbi:FecR family protein [Olivibacter sp. XZL3]|uniref:FecR family protein n=1 Tax=Olivibacter sp. XZL3 TaxID=1735116 RepID=UPI001064FCC8|nr:FecR family protein [Olivibacter sp. XZL3]